MIILLIIILKLTRGLLYIAIVIVPGLKAVMFVTPIPERFRLKIPMVAAAQVVELQLPQPVVVPRLLEDMLIIVRMIVLALVVPTIVYITKRPKRLLVQDLVPVLVLLVQETVTAVVLLIGELAQLLVVGDLKVMVVVIR